MRAKKIITRVVIVAALVLSNFCSCYVGRNYIYMAQDVREDGLSIKYPHAFDLKEAWLHDRQIVIALFAGLHRFYSNDDNDAWFEEFMKTKEYAKIDSLLQGDWEDFYYYETPKLENWEAIYGTEYEPTESYKDSIRTKMAKVLHCP